MSHSVSQLQAKSRVLGLANRPAIRRAELHSAHASDEPIAQLTASLENVTSVLNLVRATQLEQGATLQALGATLQAQGATLQAQGATLQAHGATLQAVKQQMNMVLEQAASTKVEKALGQRYAQAKTMDNVEDLVDSYIEHHGEKPPSREITGALNTLESKIAGEPLDSLSNAMHKALCCLAGNGELSAIPPKASARDLGRWVPVIKASGNKALQKAVEQVAKTMSQRENLSFVGGCESCGVALVLFASQPHRYSVDISKASTAAALVSALPPNWLEVDGVGRMLFRGSVLQIEIAEIKNTSSFKAWRKGCIQLHRALHAISYALRIMQPNLPSLPWIAFESVVLVGYVCVPKSMASSAQLDECIMAFDAHSEDECVNVVIKSLML